MIPLTHQDTFETSASGQFVLLRAENRKGP